MARLIGFKCRQQQKATWRWPASCCLQSAGGAKLLLSMAAESPDKRQCAGCGATLAANLRYCVNCYRPVAGAMPSRAHVETARRVETTHRPDPTTVFLPEVHEALVRRARRRKRALIVFATVILFAAGAVAIWLVLTHQSPEPRR